MNDDLITKLKQYYGKMIVFKEPEQSLFFKNELKLPSFMRDWLIMRFADSEGNLDRDQVNDFVKKSVPRRESWERLKDLMMNAGEAVRFLARLRIEIDIARGENLFSLPDFSYPRRKGEAIVSPYVLNKYREQLLHDDEIWGVIQLEYRKDVKGNGSVHMVDFKPFCPYQVDLDYFCEARQQFTINEWIDILLMAIDYNPEGYYDLTQKLTMLSRLLPLVERRLNLIELAPKGTGKSYVFGQISKYGWMVSGGSITRAKLFYDNSQKSPGIVARHDFVALDEIQSINFQNPQEIRGIWKDYLESGEFRVGDHKGNYDAGFILLGNIPESFMNTDLDMFTHLPDIFHESALLDRFHGFIKGWDIPRMKEKMKAHGWGLNVEYFAEILHQIRFDGRYRAIVDDILVVPNGADTRDTEAVKRLCTGYCKLLFPNIRRPNDINKGDFLRFCLMPALEMRSVIKKQLGIIDSEFRGRKMPDITLK